MRCLGHGRAAVLFAPGGSWNYGADDELCGSGATALAFWRWSEAIVYGSWGGVGIDGDGDVSVVAGGGLELLQASDGGVAVLLLEDSVFGGCGAVDVVAGVGFERHKFDGDVLGEEDLADV